MGINVHKHQLQSTSVQVWRNGPQVLALINIKTRQNPTLVAITLFAHNYIILLILSDSRTNPPGLLPGKGQRAAPSRRQHRGN